MSATLTMQLPSAFRAAAAGAHFNRDWVRFEGLTIEGLAWMLAHINRFGGATSRPVSVAEHSLNVEALICKRHAPPAVAMQALLHDAHEAFLTDVPTPARALLAPTACSDLDSAARILDVAIEHALLGFSFTAPVSWTQTLKDCDLEALALEAAQNGFGPQQTPPAGDWHLKLGVTPPATLLAKFNSPRSAANAFARRFRRIRLAMGRS